MCWAALPEDLAHLASYEILHVWRGLRGFRRSWLLLENSHIRPLPVQSVINGLQSAVAGGQMALAASQKRVAISRVMLRPKGLASRPDFLASDASTGAGRLVVPVLAVLRAKLARAVALRAFAEHERDLAVPMADRTCVKIAMASTAIGHRELLTIGRLLGQHVCVEGGNDS
jgi:hypothetical protein